MRRLSSLVRGGAYALALLLLAACSFVVEVDGVPHVVRVRPWTTATPSPTPSPSRTPTPTLTATPTPSRTPTASVNVTPTQETALPTATLPSTPRPTPDKGNCLVKTGRTALNERKVPSTVGNTPVGVIPPGSIVAVTEFATAEGYLWARSVFGWFAVRQGNTWWVTFVADTIEWCVELPGYPPGVSPPPPIVRALPGVWVGPGANRDELLQFGAALQAAGYTPAATVYGEPVTADLLLARGWFVLRRASSVPDCPNMTLPPEQSAAAFIGRVVDAEGTRTQVIVGANECAWPSVDYAAQWIRAAGQTARARGVRALVPVVWNTGAPEIAWVATLAPVYRNAPVALLWGMNLYPTRRGTGLAVRNALTSYTTWRWEHYRAHLRGVPLVVTEFARGDGSEPPQWADISAWWTSVRETFLVATAWYVAGEGGLGQWTAANLRGRLDQLAEVFHK